MQYPFAATLPPLFWPTIVLISSIGITNGWLHQAWNTSIIIALALAFICLMGGLAWRSAQGIPFALFLLIAASTGGIRTYRCHQRFEQNKARVWHNPVCIEGRISGINARYDSPIRQCLTLGTARISDAKNARSPQPDTLTVAVYASSPLDVMIGDTIAISPVTLHPPKDGDFAWYLTKEGIDASAFVANPIVTILHRPAYSLVRTCFKQKMRIFDALKKKTSRKAFTLFATLFLGERAYNKRYVQSLHEEFQYWGLMHYLARSGLHMVIFAATWEFIFRLLPIPFLIRHLLLLVLYGIYFVLSWPSVPFIRAFMTVVLYKMCIVLQRPVHFFAVIPLICCFFLIFNPLQLFFLDFQLSFLITFALSWFNHATMKYAKS